jgi:hypothetical protein
VQGIGGAFTEKCDRKKVPSGLDFKDRSRLSGVRATLKEPQGFRSIRAAFSPRRARRGMKVLAAALGAAFFVLAARAPAPMPPTLYFFFTLDTPDAARAVREARRAAGTARFRPVFLLDRRLPADYEPAPELGQAMAELGQDVAVVDAEGLDLARRFGVRSTPCAVWTGEGTHRGAGANFNWKELTACERSR